MNPEKQKEVLEVQDKIIGIYKYKVITYKDGTSRVKGELKEPFKTLHKKRYKTLQEKHKRLKKEIDNLLKPWWKFW